VARLHFQVANLLSLPWLREKIAALPGDQHWQMLARGAMQDDLSALQRAVTSAALALGGEGVESWKQANRRALERATQLLAELRGVPQPDSAMLAVALRELRALA
jgi:glutamate dehydrogenase